MIMILWASDQGGCHAFREGMAALSRPCHVTPSAFKRLMELLVRGYLAAAKACGEEPDMTLAAPILKKLASLD